MNRLDAGIIFHDGGNPLWRGPCERLRGKGMIGKKSVFVVRFKHGGKNSAMILWNNFYIPVVGVFCYFGFFFELFIIV